MFVLNEEEQIPSPHENGGIHVINLYSDNVDVEKDQLELNMRDLQGEIESLKMQVAYQDEKRRAALNKILDIKGNIRVFCRVRPFLLTAKRRIRQPISIEKEKIVINYVGARKEFGFDKVFAQEASQEDVFAEVEPILRSALDGHNVCLLAYGQTGTGKTFTMDGTNESPGLIPRVLRALFGEASSEHSTSFTFSISMVEVYLGSLRDLLTPKKNRSYAESRCNPTIQINSKGLVEIEGLTEVKITNLTKASWWYTKGRRVRSTSWTNVNEASSRSHCLTKITIYRGGDAPGGKTEVSKLWMVDLGGSERLLKTGATGQTMDEGRAINLSLSALGDVIAALRRKKGHVPYRNSKLTQIIRDSLGDGSKVVMFVHASPYEEDVAETTCSVSFAKRARAVEFSRELSEELKRQKENRISEHEGEMQEAEEECEKLQKQIRKIEFLLAEYKRISTPSCPSLEEVKNPESPKGAPVEEVKNPESPKGAPVEVLTTPKASDKTITKYDGTSLPRFMSSTAASRHRKSTAERKISSSVRSFRSETRSLIQISGSQSNSYSDSRFKATLRNSNKKPRYEESACSIVGDAKCDVLQSNSAAMTPGRTSTRRNPNMKVTAFHHRRRMSNVI